MTHVIGIFAAAAASTAALIEFASIETSTMPSYFSWTACWTKPACLAGVNSPSKTGDGVQPIALAAVTASSAPCLQLMPALPHEMTATLPLPGSTASVGCGHVMPVVCEYFLTAAPAAAMSAPPLEPPLLDAVLAPLELLLLSSELPQP